MNINIFAALPTDKPQKFNLTDQSYRATNTAVSMTQIQETLKLDVVSMHVPETIWRDEERPSIQDISSCSADQENHSQPHLEGIA